MNFLIKTVFIYFISISISFANEIKVFNFSETELYQLDVRKVRGADNKTVYTVGSNENGNFLKAVADNAASGLGKEIKIDLNKTPFINITWKIEKDLPGIKENTKKGHDFAPSPYTKKSIDNVLANTQNNLNQWVTVKANVKEDFKKFHDLDVNELDGLAIMTDTDNSKMKAIAYFQNIYFSSE